MNKIRLIVYPTLLVAIISTLVMIQPIDVNCQQCNQKCFQEPLIARCAANFDENFLHFECVSQWCTDNPVQFDQNGNVINKG